MGNSENGGFGRGQHHFNVCLEFISISQKVNCMYITCGGECVHGNNKCAQTCGLNICRRAAYFHLIGAKSLKDGRISHYDNLDKLLSVDAAPCIVSQTDTAGRETHVEIFSYVYCVILSSLALHNKRCISGEQSRKDTPTEKLCSQLLDSVFSPLRLIFILLLSGLFSPKSWMPEGGSGSDSCGHRSPVTSDSSVLYRLFLAPLSFP